MTDYGRRSGNYLVLDFDNITDRGLAKLTQALERAGSPVATVEANNRRSRRDGRSIKRAKLTFENGQVATLMVGEDGDVYQMTLNAKKHPLPDGKTTRRFATELHKDLVRAQPAFDKSQQAKLARAAKKAAAGEQPKRKATPTLTKRAEAARSKLSGLEADSQKLATLLSDKQAELTELSSEESQLKAKLEQEQTDTRRLKEELANLQESM